MASADLHFRLDDLPLELIRNILSHLQRHELLEVASVNIGYYELAMEHMLTRYEYNRNEDVSGYDMRCFMCALTAYDVSRVWCLEDLCLRNDWYDKFDENEYKGHRNVYDVANRIGKWLMWEATGLKRLHVAYHPELYFLEEGLPPKLEELVVRPEGRPECEWKHSYSDEIEFAESLNLHFLPSVLKSTSLKRLDIGAETVVNEEALTLANDVPVAESSIEHLVMKVGNFNDKAMAQLLRAIEGLKTFHFSPVIREELSNCERFLGFPWMTTSAIEDLPTISVMGTSLQQHAETLEELTIVRGFSFWHRKIDTIGSLASFTALRYLNINIGTLLGWNHCEHNDFTGETSSIGPFTLASLLPPNLEILELSHDQHHSARNGTKYFLDIINGLIADSSRLRNLKKVILGGTMPYCEECGIDDSWRGIVIPPVRTHLMSIQESRKIKEAVKEATFEFFSRHDGIYWDEESPESDVKERVFPVLREEAIAEVVPHLDRRFPMRNGVPATWRYVDSCKSMRSPLWLLS